MSNNYGSCQPPIPVDSPTSSSVSYNPGSPRWQQPADPQADPMTQPTTFIPPVLLLSFPSALAPKKSTVTVANEMEREILRCGVPCDVKQSIPSRQYLRSPVVKLTIARDPTLRCQFNYLGESGLFLANMFAGILYEYLKEPSDVGSVLKRWSYWYARLGIPVVEIVFPGSQDPMILERRIPYAKAFATTIAAFVKNDPFCATLAATGATRQYIKHMFGKE